MSTGALPEFKVRPPRKAYNITVIGESIVYKMWNPLFLTILQTFTACHRVDLLFLYVF
jgi:hypothetical protein